MIPNPHEYHVASLCDLPAKPDDPYTEWCDPAGRVWLKSKGFDVLRDDIRRVNTPEFNGWTQPKMKR